jgi:hypothetical protein
MAVVNSGILSKQFDRDILKMFMNRYGSRATEYDKLFKIEEAPPGRTFRSAEISGLGNAVEIPEGSGVPFDFPEEGNDKSVDFPQTGLGFQVTEMMLEDLVHAPLKSMSETLADSMMNRVEIDCFRLFNLGATPLASGGEGASDGKPIFATDHQTLKSKTIISNLGTAALSETGLQAAFEYFDTLVNESGFPLPDLKLKRLIVPTGLRWIAMRLAKQSGGISASVDLSGNDMTTNPANGYVGAWEVHISNFLQDADAWFTMAENHQFILMWKRKTRMQAGDDFQTGNRLYKATNRFRAFCLDYKPVYGSFPT